MYSVYGEAGQTWSETNREVFRSIHQHVLALPAGALWFAAGDFNMEPAMLKEKANEFGWQFVVRVPSLATCVSVGSSSCIDYLICEPPSRACSMSLM